MIFLAAWIKPCSEWRAQTLRVQPALIFQKFRLRHLKIDFFSYGTCNIM